MSPIPGLLYSSIFLPLPLLLCCSVSLCLIVVSIILGALLRADERPRRLHSLTIDRHSPCPCATLTFGRPSGRPYPPPLLFLLVLPVSIIGPRHYIPTKNLDGVVEADWLAKLRARGFDVCFNFFLFPDYN